MVLTKSKFSDAVIEHFKHWFTVKWGLSGEEFDAFAQANMWFITDTSKAGLGNPEAAMKAYKKLHFDFLKALLGQHLNRKIDVQPFGYAFVDFASTRTGAWKVQTRPHIHALLMIHPSTREKLSEIGPEVELFRKAKRYRPQRHGPMLNMATYAMKGVVGERTSYFDDVCAFEVFPCINPRPKRKKKTREAIS